MHVAKSPIKINMNTLIEKYKVPVPRYTSYPTITYWDTNLIAFYNYVHLPWIDTIRTIKIDRKTLVKTFSSNRLQGTGCSVL